MKSFLIASAIMFVVLSAVIPISFYNSHKLEDLYSCVEKLPEQLKENDNSISKQIQEIEMLWAKSNPVFELTISRRAISKADVEIINIYTYAKTKNKSEYTATRNRLLFALKDMRNSESLSWNNIL